MNEQPNGIERARVVHTPRTAVLLTVLSLAVILCQACQPGAASAGGGGQKVTVKALDTMKFDPPTLTVQAGQPTHLTLDNAGALVHDFVLTEGTEQAVKVETGGKASGTAVFTIAKPGTYTYMCSQPGHEAAGMKGTIVAK